MRHLKENFMISRIYKIFAVAGFVLATALSAPSAQAQRYGDDRNDRDNDRRHERCDDCGTVRSVQRINGRNKQYGGATLLGAIVGGALGHTVGKGDGRKAATVVGAVAGGAVGHNVEKNNRNGAAYRISVRMDGGRIYTIDQDDSYGLRSGDHVELQNGYVVPRG
jgi:outer membrane lipoprotein SlyB